MTCKDGARIPVRCTTSNITGSAGGCVNTIFLFRKVLKPDPCRLNGSEYRRLFETTKDMIFILFKDGRFLDFNQALVDHLGYGKKQDLLALKFIKNIFIEDIHWQVFQRQMNLHGYVRDFEAGLKTKEGNRLHCSLSANAVRKNGGSIVGYEGIAKDITARMDAFRNLYKHHQELLLLNFSMGAIFLVNYDRGGFELKAQRGVADWVDDASVTLNFHDQELMEFLLKPDSRLTPKSIFPSFKLSLDNAKTGKTTTLTCFLITEKEKPSGFMAFWIKNDEDLSIEDFHLLGSLGNFVGGAIANIHLIKTVQKHREELKRITAQLFQSQEAECRRISRELHDETGSSLIGINLKLDAVENEIPGDAYEARALIRSVKGQINHTYMDMRRISHRLHPALLTDLGLEPALDQYIAEIAERTRLDITFKMIGFTGRIDPDIETVLYRFSQEALSNALKHSKAKVFRLSIIKSYPAIIFIADDDGVGFNADMDASQRPALGLLSMRERATMHGGKFTLRSTIGEGTNIRIEIPMNKQGGYIGEEGAV